MCVCAVCPDRCSIISAACTGEIVDSMGIVSETCYQMSEIFAQGVTECASFEKGKRAVTPECKKMVFSHMKEQCEAGTAASSSWPSRTGCCYEFKQFEDGRQESYCFESSKTIGSQAECPEGSQ